MVSRLHTPGPLRRVATLSVHTSPLDQPGAGDAGGMNVYIVEVSRRLAARGIDVEVFTRATSSDLPPVVEMSPGVLVRHVTAGPFEGLGKEELPAQLCAFTAAVLREEAEARYRQRLVGALGGFLVPTLICWVIWLSLLLAGTGTAFAPTGARLSARRFWLRHAAGSAGRLQLDDGAVAAVVARRRSLLAAGITGLDGDFEAGDVVELNPDNALDHSFIEKVPAAYAYLCAVRRLSFEALGRARVGSVIFIEERVIGHPLSVTEGEGEGEAGRPIYHIVLKLVRGETVMPGYAA